MPNSMVWFYGACLCLYGKDLLRVIRQRSGLHECTYALVSEESGITIVDHRFDTNVEVLAPKGVDDEKITDPLNYNNVNICITYTVVGANNSVIISQIDIYPSRDRSQGKVVIAHVGPDDLCFCLIPPFPTFCFCKPSPIKGYNIYVVVS